MVAAEALALVVRQRGGPNLMVHTRGISGVVASRACEEAVTIMGRFALGRAETDVDGSGDIHPKFAHDKLLVMNGRYAVVYRLVHKVWVMAVTETQMDSLVPVRLVETATKGLVATCQILEVDNDVIARNYQEVHFMMSAILKYQGANLPKAQTEALANIYSFIADTRDKKGRSNNESSKRLPVVRIEKQNLTHFNGADQNFDFVLPSDFKRLQKSDGALMPSDLTSGFGLPLNPQQPPLPQKQGTFTFEDLSPVIPKPVTAAPVAQPMPFTDLDDLLGGPTVAEVTVRETSLVDFVSVNEHPTVPAVQLPSFPMTPTAVSQSPFPAASPIAKPESQTWLNFTMDTKQEPVYAVSTPTTQTPPQKPWPLLFLLEKWQGVFEGNICTESSAVGEVGLRKQIWKNVAGKDLKFKLLYSGDQEQMSRGLRCLMKCVKCNVSRTGVLHDGMLSAKMQPAPAPYLKYSLLPGLYDAPVRVCVTSAMTSLADGRKCVVLLIHVATNGRNKSAANGSVFAWLPRPFGPPAYARPKPRFSKNQSCLKWPIHNMQPGQNTMMKAMLPTSGVVDDDIAKLIRVSLNCVGRPGNTLSDLCLSQEFTPGTNVLSETPEAAVWSASVTARP